MAKAEIGRSGVQATHMKRVKAAGGRSYKFVSPGRRNVPDTIDLLGLDEAAREVSGLMERVRHAEREGVVQMKFEPYAWARIIVAAAVRFTECKAPRKKPRRAQQREIKRIRDMGYRVDVVDQ